MLFRSPACPGVQSRVLSPNSRGGLTPFSPLSGLQEIEERKNVPFPNHPKVQLLRGTRILILMAPQIRRLKPDQGLDHSVTEIPRYFTMDHGSISLSGKRVCELNLGSPLRLEWPVFLNLKVM